LSSSSSSSSSTSSSLWDALSATTFSIGNAFGVAQTQNNPSASASAGRNSSGSSGSSRRAGGFTALATSEEDLTPEVLELGCNAGDGVVDEERHDCDITHSSRSTGSMTSLPSGGGGGLAEPGGCIQAGATKGATAASRREVAAAAALSRLQASNPVSLSSSSRDSRADRALSKRGGRGR
jgi:hypothetical protein